MKLSLPLDRLYQQKKSKDKSISQLPSLTKLDLANTDAELTIRFLRWALLLSVVALLLNISTWVAKPSPERLGTIFITLSVTPLSFWAYKEAQRGRALRGLSIETVVIAIASFYNSFVISYAGFVAMFFPFALFVSLMTQLNRREARILAIVNLLSSLINMSMSVWSLSQGRPITQMESINILIGITVMTILMFVRLILYQGHMHKMVNVLQTNNEHLITLEKELTAKSTLLAERNLILESLRDSAIQSSELKSQFVSTISHELRTPLHGIQGYLELMQETKLDEEQRDYVNTAYESSVALNDIINEVLDFARIERGTIEITREPVNIHQLLLGVLETLNIKARQKGLQMTYSIAPNVPSPLMIDKQRVRQILINLVGNAIKFTQKGSVNIAVQIPSAISDQLFISVTDTGIGVPPALISKLFQPFVQNVSAGHAQIGTGLGLSIVKRLVELMGGQVGVESVVGEGARFWFTIYAPQVQLTQATKIT